MALQERTQIITEFGSNAKDTGSTEVQIALLTKAINELTVHCQINPKDFSSKRGLLQKVCRRRRLLQYLENGSSAKYRALITKLGLRK